ncbi:MAG TPA: alpha/beta hydrolase [Reyranella sp.]|nr:alpha/beta hydrolase [Reyranella sp.]
MTPVAFAGSFGWLHTPAFGTGDVAVLICPGIAYDALLSHASLRLLGDDLAEAGYPTLRFDYPGTADACDDGIEEAGGHWNAWRRSVDAAANWLKATTGARRLIVCGLRGGGMLATLAAAARDDVAGLVLLAPVLRGQSYMRQLQVEAQIRNGHESVPDDGLVYREFIFNQETVAAISAVDLRTAVLKAGQKVIVYSQAESRLTAECAEAWSANGAEVMCRGWEGMEPLLRHHIVDETSLADFSGLVGWLRRAVPQTGQLPLAPLPPAELRPPGCIETPMRFGEDDRLFGMLCRPIGQMSETVVIIGNGGRDPHYGAARHAVAFARRLARLGIASLRMDFAGLGDSLGPPGQERFLTHMLSLDRNADISAAVDALEELGFRRFAMQGLCAGAYHGFHGALAEPRLSVLLLINMPMFTLPDAGALEYLTWREMSPAVFLKKLPRLGSWISLLQRRRDLGTILRVQFDRVRAQATNRLRGLAVRFGLAPQPSFAQAALASLSARGVRTLFLFSRGDAELDVFRQEFNDPDRDLSAYAGAAWRIVKEIDHDLTLVAGRDIVEAVMIDFIESRDISLGKVQTFRPKAVLA